MAFNLDDVIAISHAFQKIGIHVFETEVDPHGYTVTIPHTKETEHVVHITEWIAGYRVVDYHYYNAGMRLVNNRQIPCMEVQLVAKDDD